MSVLSLKSEGWTPAERSIVNVLVDGRPHPISEFYENDGTEFAILARNTVRVVVNGIRHKLKDHNMGVMVEYVNGEAHWRIVRYLSHEDL